MDQQKKSVSSEKMMMIWVGVGIALAIAFIVIGSVFFGLKPGPSGSTNSNSEPIDASQYAPSGY